MEAGDHLQIDACRPNMNLSKTNSVLKTRYGMSKKGGTPMVCKPKKEKKKKERKRR